jgi:hypothetical protein
VFNFRGSVRTAGVAVGIAALVLGVFAGTAFACRDSGGDHEKPTSSSNGPPGDSQEGNNDQENGDQPSGGDQSTPPPVLESTPPPVVESTPVPAPVPVATGLLPAAAQPAVAVTPAPAPAPATPAATSAPVVKGEIGTAWSGSGGQAPTVLAATGDVGPSVAQAGGLARTGFDLFPVAILGGLALGGSAFFFRRFQAC